MIGNQLKLLLGWVLMGLNRYCVQVPISSPEFELTVYTFYKQQFDPEIKERANFTSQVNCCGVSEASEQQHNQDLKRISKREYEFSNSSLFTRMHCI